MALWGMRVLSSADSHHPACLAADGAQAPVGTAEYEEYVAARLHSNDGCYVAHFDDSAVEEPLQTIVPDGLTDVLGTFKALSGAPGMKTVEAVLFNRATTLLPGDALKRYWYSEAWEAQLVAAAEAGPEAAGFYGELWKGPYAPVLAELRNRLNPQGGI